MSSVATPVGISIIIKWYHAVLLWCVEKLGNLIDRESFSILLKHLAPGINFGFAHLFFPQKLGPGTRDHFSPLGRAWDWRSLAQCSFFQLPNGMRKQHYLSKALNKLNEACRISR